MTQRRASPYGAQSSPSVRPIGPPYAPVDGSTDMFVAGKSAWGQFPTGADSVFDLVGDAWNGLLNRQDGTIFIAGILAGRAPCAWQPPAWPGTRGSSGSRACFYPYFVDLLDGTGPYDHNLAVAARVASEAPQKADADAKKAPNAPKKAAADSPAVGTEKASLQKTPPQAAAPADPPPTPTAETAKTITDKLDLLIGIPVLLGGVFFPMPEKPALCPRMFAVFFAKRLTVFSAQIRIPKQLPQGPIAIRLGRDLTFAPPATSQPARAMVNGLFIAGAGGQQVATTWALGFVATPPAVREGGTERIVVAFTEKNGDGSQLFFMTQWEVSKALFSLTDMFRPDNFAAVREKRRTPATIPILTPVLLANVRFVRKENPPCGGVGPSYAVYVNTTPATHAFFLELDIHTALIPPAVLHAARAALAAHPPPVWTEAADTPATQAASEEPFTPPSEKKPRHEEDMQQLRRLLQSNDE